jgi:hypothetical protein
MGFAIATHSHKKPSKILGATFVTPSRKPRIQISQKIKIKIAPSL